jgi:5'-AMP-activated protein kinase catalytic alpha subunit
VHRDLKPENILLDEKKNIRIVDFGLSNTYRKGELLKTPCGSPCYAAPEMIKGEKYDGLRVDIWSSGVILFAMLCGYLPFEDPDTPALYKKILAGTYNTHRSLSEEAKDIIGRILNGNHHERYTIEQIRNHPWMSKQDCGDNPEGIIVGFNKIPIDKEVLSQMRTLSLDPDYVSKCLEANRHNNATTAYYLSLKKFISEGGQTSCDLSSKSFDKSVLEPYRRKQTAKNVVLDNFFTKSTEEGPRKSKEKSREK